MGWHSLFTEQELILWIFSDTTCSLAQPASTWLVCTEWQRQGQKFWMLQERFLKFIFNGCCCLFLLFPRKNCKNVKCSTITCKLEDITLKGEYFVNISTQIWNGTFAAVSISCKYFQTPDTFQSSVQRLYTLERPSFTLYWFVFFQIENLNLKVVRLHNGADRTSVQHGI